jgi:GxxExxY protein
MTTEEATTKIAKDAKKEVQILFQEESCRITGACFEVYKELGCGFLEAVYQECLAREFRAQAIPFIEKPLLNLKYKGELLEQTYVPDFLCYDEIILEIKSAKYLANEHRSQTINYLKTTGKSLALLVNFGHHPRLESERFVNQEISRLS